MIDKLKRKVKMIVSYIIPRFYFLPNGTMIFWLGMEFFF